ncbi:MAG TPA: hypothetical protein VH186_02270 [Chloroflexia bacterium]|nr:hypothetical protein [Chloroflexia bacterium]
MLKRWLLKIRGPVIYLALLGLLIAGAYNGADLLRTSLESYQPIQVNVGPAQSLTTFNDSSAVGDTTGTDTTGDGGAATTQTRRPGTTAPLTNRVVLVVVNGLSQNDVETLSSLQNETFKKISTGAYLFTGQVEPAVPGLVTLLTGASQELTAGLQFDQARAALNTPTPAEQLSQFDNLFASVKRSKFTTALFGTPDWYSALPPNMLDYYTTFDPRQPAGDIADNALNFLKKKSANFTLIQIAALQQAEQDYGTDSPQVSQARENLDKALTRLTSDEMDLRHTTLIITGDWDNSAKAGDRWTVPMVMVGQAVQPGDKIWARQEDVTSTISALLGVEVPRHNQGRFMSSLLSMPAIDQGEKYLALVEQRQTLDIAYRQRLDLPLPLATNDPQAVEAEKNVTLARQNYRLGSYEGIEQEVDWVLRYTRADMDQARQDWFAQARWQRAALSVVLLLLPLVLFLVWRSALSLVAASGALLATLLPFGFYRIQGKSFNFNSIALPDLQEMALWQAGLALLLSLFVPLVFFDWAERRRMRHRGRVDLEYQQIAELRRPAFPFARLLQYCLLFMAWLVYFGGFVLFVWYYWRFGYFGPLMGQPPLLPDHSASFLEFFSLYHLFGFGLALIPMPLVLIIFYWIKRRIRGDKYEEEEEQDILQKPRPGAEAGIIKV